VTCANHSTAQLIEN